MSYLLGIKQGTISTKAVVMDELGNVLSYHKTHGSYFPYDGIEQSVRFVARAVEGALGDADVSILDINTIVAGVAGIDLEGDDKFFQGELTKFFDSGGLRLSNGCKVYIVNDCDIAYYSGTTNPVGALIYLGSGANAIYFSPDGRRFAWGYYIKNMLQGASAIARRSIEAVFDAEIGILPKTKLEQMFLNYLGDDNVDELLIRRMRNPSFDRSIISLAPQIFKIADEGDEVTISVLRKYSIELSDVFVAGLKRMNLDGEHCDIVLAGALLQGSDNILITMLTEEISKTQKNANIIKAKFDSAVGACIMGIVKTMGAFDDEMYENLVNTSKWFNLYSL